MMLTASTAQPDFRIDPTLLDHEIQKQLNLLPMSLAGAHNLTGMNEVYSRYGLTGKGQTVAVIDSGIAWDHQALGGGFGSGYRVVGGWDFTESERKPYDDGPYGSHGTHVAGIVGSSDPANRGVAPGVDIVALRVFDDQGYGWFSWVEEALDWVYQNRNSFRNPITTVNLSLGSSWNSSEVPNWAMLEDEFRLLNEVGIFVAVAAGNSFQEYASPGLSYPAASPWVVPVMSVTSTGQMSYFSQRHTSAIAAPGSGIRSTVPDYAGNYNGRTDDFASYSGTSMAAPYIAGAAIILRQALEQAGRVNIDQDMIYRLMRDTADKFYDWETDTTYLRINIKRAVDSLLGDREGSSKTTAMKVGTLTTRAKLSGDIRFDGDRDYFTFTARTTGTLKVTAKLAAGLTTRWREYLADGTTRAVSGNILTMKVVAGRTYTIRLDGLSGTGDYSLEFCMVPRSINIGVTGNATVRKLATSKGEVWIKLRETRTGEISTQLGRAKGVKIAVYDSNMRRVAYDATKLNACAEGLVDRNRLYYIRLVGADSDFFLRIRTTRGIPDTATASTKSATAPSTASFSAIDAASSPASAAIVSAANLAALPPAADHGAVPEHGVGELNRFNDPVDRALEQESSWAAQDTQTYESFASTNVEPEVWLHAAQEMFDELKSLEGDALEGDEADLLAACA